MINSYAELFFFSWPNTLTQYQLYPSVLLERFLLGKCNVQFCNASPTDFLSFLFLSRHFLSIHYLPF